MFESIIETANKIKKKSYIIGVCNFVEWYL